MYPSMCFDPAVGDRNAELARSLWLELIHST
jgi:hypothetical protein